MRNILFASLICFSFLIVSCEKTQEVVEDTEETTEEAVEDTKEMAGDAADAAEDTAGEC